MRLVHREIFFKKIETLNLDETLFRGYSQSTSWPLNYQTKLIFFSEILAITLEMMYLDDRTVGSSRNIFKKIETLNPDETLFRGYSQSNSSPLN